MVCIRTTRRRRENDGGRCFADASSVGVFRAFAPLLLLLLFVIIVITTMAGPMVLRAGQGGNSETNCAHGPVGERKSRGHARIELAVAAAAAADERRRIVIDRIVVEINMPQRDFATRKCCVSRTRMKR